MNDATAPSNWTDWEACAPFSVWGSDVVLRLHHVLTEPTCPDAYIEFENPDRTGIKRIASGCGNTIEEAILKAVTQAREVLPKMTEERRKELASRGSAQIDLDDALEDTDPPLQLLSRGGQKVTITSHAGYCPVQSYGSLLGAKFYFRARGSCARLYVGEVGSEMHPLDAPEWVHEKPWGTTFEAGWMSRKEAITFILEAADLYQEWKEKAA